MARVAACHRTTPCRTNLCPLRLRRPLPLAECNGPHSLAMVCVLLDRLAFLSHTVPDRCDEECRRVRAELATRQTFYEIIVREM